jgi:urate oxidase
MDILAYNYLWNGLADFNEKSGKPHGNALVHYPSANPTYPYTVFDEIRNVANSTYNSCYERVASVGYVLRVYAKNKGKIIDKQTIAREVAQVMDTYLSGVNLTRVSFNANESVNDNSIYEIIMTYSGNLHENRRNFI